MQKNVNFTFDDVPKEKPEKREKEESKVLQEDWDPVYMTSESSDAGDIDVDDLDLDIDFGNAENDESTQDSQKQETEIIFSINKNSLA